MNERKSGLCAIMALLTVVACRPAPLHVLVVDTSSRCRLCAKEVSARRDSFKLRASENDVRNLGLYEYSDPSSPRPQSFTVQRILDTLRQGRMHYSMATYHDTCESCLNAKVPLQVGRLMVCQQCGKTYARDVSKRMIHRKDFKGDSVQTLKGTCGSGACRLRSKHPDWTLEDCQTIRAGKVQIGFTTEQVVCAWGRPSDINRTVGSWGVHEQWVYQHGDCSMTCLYFEDGVLTSFQD